MPGDCHAALARLVRRRSLKARQLILWPPLPLRMMKPSSKNLPPPPTDSSSRMMSSSVLLLPLWLAPATGDVAAGNPAGVEETSRFSHAITVPSDTLGDARRWYSGWWSSSWRTVRRSRRLLEDGEAALAEVGEGSSWEAPAESLWESMVLWRLCGPSIG